jgi:hypothetical protein
MSVQQPRKVGQVPKMANLIALLKSIIGQCMDEEPHFVIRGQLWRAVKMAYQLLEQERSHVTGR